MRRCTICGINKPLHRDNFKRNSCDVYHETCRACEDKIKLAKHNDENGNLFCIKCKEYLHPDNFAAAAHPNEYRLGKDVRCKSCRTKQSAYSRKSKVGQASVDRILQERFLNAKLRSAKKNLIFAITEEYLHELLDSQKGKCALSGIELTFLLGNGRIFTNVSIDRKDPLLGYTEDNVQLVCMAVNQMKSDLSKEQLIDFCKKIVDYGDIDKA